MWKNIAVRIKRIGKIKLTTIAGAWVFYFLLAIVPLTFLVFSALNFFNVNIHANFVNYLPEGFSYPIKLITSTAKEIGKASTALFLITVLFSSTTLITQMSKDGDFIFGQTRKLKFSLLRRVGALMLLTVIVGVVIVGGTVFSLKGAGTIFNVKLFQNFRAKVVFNCTITLLIAYVVLLLLNRFISPVRLKWIEACVGALVSLGISVIGTLCFVLYVKFFGFYNAFYGVISIILIFLLWVYILMVGIILGVLVTAKMYYCRFNTRKR